MSQSYENVCFRNLPPAAEPTPECLRQLDCLQGLSGVCLDITETEELTMAIEDTNVTFSEVEGAFKSYACSILRLSDENGTDPCTVLQNREGARRRTLSVGNRHLQSLTDLVDPVYPDMPGPNFPGPYDYEMLINDMIREDFLNGEENKRSDADRYANLVFQQIPEAVRRRTQTTKDCLIGNQAGDIGATLIGLIPGVGDKINAFVSIFLKTVDTVCQAEIIRWEERAAMLSLLQARIDTHDGIIDGAEIEAVNINVRRLDLKLIDQNLELRTLGGLVGSARDLLLERIADIDVTDSLATTRTALEGQIAAIDGTVAEISGDIMATGDVLRQDISVATEALSGRIDDLEAAMKLRIDELEGTMRSLITIATAVDASVTFIVAAIQSATTNDSKKKKGGRRKGIRRQRFLEDQD